MDSNLVAIAKDGVRLACHVAGTGAPVVLVHGYASSLDQNWHSTGWIDRLAREGFRVVSFDCRGHGLSDKPHQPERYGDRMVDDILAVMEACAVEDAFLMGYSMGAMLTVAFLMRYPQRVRRVVAAGVGDNYFNEQPSWRHRIADAMLTDDPSAVADADLRRFRLFGGQKGKDRQALAACMRSPRSIHPPAALKGAKRPVLVATGERDTLAGSPFALAGSFADGRALVLPNKDHMSAVGDPGLKRAVLDFFLQSA